MTKVTQNKEEKQNPYLKICKCILTLPSLLPLFLKKRRKTIINQSTGLHSSNKRFWIKAGVSPNQKRVRLLLKANWVSIWLFYYKMSPHFSHYNPAIVKRKIQPTKPIIKQFAETNQLNTKSHILTHNNFHTTTRTLYIKERIDRLIWVRGLVKHR